MIKCLTPGSLTFTTSLSPLEPHSSCKDFQSTKTRISLAGCSFTTKPSAKSPTSAWISTACASTKMMNNRLSVLSITINMVKRKITLISRKVVILQKLILGKSLAKFWVLVQVLQHLHLFCSLVFLATCQNSPLSFIFIHLLLSYRPHHGPTANKKSLENR